MSVGTANAAEIVGFRAPSQRVPTTRLLSRSLTLSIFDVDWPSITVLHSRSEHRYSNLLVCAATYLADGSLIYSFDYSLTMRDAAIL